MPKEKKKKRSKKEKKEEKSEENSGKNCERDKKSIEKTEKKKKENKSNKERKSAKKRKRSEEKDDPVADEEVSQKRRKVDNDGAGLQESTNTSGVSNITSGWKDIISNSQPSTFSVLSLLDGVANNASSPSSSLPSTDNTHREKELKDRGKKGEKVEEHEPASLTEQPSFPEHDPFPLRQNCPIFSSLYHLNFSPLYQVCVGGRASAMESLLHKRTIERAVCPFERPWPMSSGHETDESKSKEIKTILIPNATTGKRTLHMVPSFVQAKSKEAVVEEWKKRRQDLTADYKKKRKSALNRTRKSRKRQ